jgi:diaminohydroxyphosphoribosylaminopyrimidine deaminase/5-amino-6-(5-phosphoribosylamino)uracil reductase
VEYCPIDFTENVLPQVIEKLYQEQLQSLLVEGGSQLLQSFIDANLWDEIHIEHCPMLLGDGVPAPLISLKKPYKEVLKWGRKYHIIYNFV